MPDGELNESDKRAKAIRDAKAASQADRLAFLQAFRDYLLSIANARMDSDLKAKIGASDLVNQSILEADKGLAAFQGTTEQQLKQWLARILKNNIADQSARPAMRLPSLDKLFEEGQLPEPRAETPDVPARVEMLEKIAALGEALCDLTQDHQEILRLRTERRRTFAEIAVLIGCTEDAAKQRWHAALERLRAHPSMRPHLQDNAENA